MIEIIKQFLKTNEPLPAPLVMYYVVREDLNMSCGKIAAQVSHATQLMMMNYQTIDNEHEHFLRLHAWMQQKINGGFRKIILSADEKEWAKVKNLNPPVLIVDAGLTEIEPGSETVCLFYPMFKDGEFDERPKLLKRLRLFK